MKPEPTDSSVLIGNAPTVKFKTIDLPTKRELLAAIIMSGRNEYYLVKNAVQEADALIVECAKKDEGDE